MRARHWIIVAAAWLTASAGFAARDCQAGFLAAGEAVQWLSDGDSSAAGGSPCRGLGAQEEPGEDPTISVESAALSQGTTSSSMTGGGPSSATSGSVYAALPESLPSLAMPSAERLMVAESKLIPAVYLSRVFRPPRV